MEKTTNLENRLTIGFTGDLSFSGYFQGCEKQDILSQEVKAFFADNNATIINLESPITTSSDMTKLRLAHRCQPEAVEFLKVNFQNPVASLANNHMMDYSAQGLLDTFRYLREAQIPKIGAGNNLKEALKPIIIEEKGISVAVISIQYKKSLIASEKGCGPLHDSCSKEIKAQIKSLKSKADYVVVVYHGGEEFLHTPMPYARKQLQGYIKAGADAVVAHHPHTVQGYEKYKGKMIFYSLGNFIFDTDYQRSQKDTEDGMLVKLAFTKEGLDWEYLPVHIERETHRIVARTCDKNFDDLASIDYDAFWHEEAYRKKLVLKIANDLEKAELAELKEQGLVTEEEIRKPKGIRKVINKVSESLKDPKDALRRFEKKRTLQKGRKIYLRRK